MSEESKVVSMENAAITSTDAPPALDAVLPQNDACATANPQPNPKIPALPKKKRTRRGKCKRKNPYQKYGRKTNKSFKLGIVKPEAPHNDNQFLLEDHGGFEELDERLRHIDQASTASLSRTRDSSFSVDSDGEEFFSSPGDDDTQYFMQEFDDQYQTMKIERLQEMTKQELVERYIALETSATQSSTELLKMISTLKLEIENKNEEKEALKREIELLKAQIEECQKHHSDSADSETDSSDSESSNSHASSSGDSNRSQSPLLKPDNVDYTQTNGHTPTHASVDAV